MTHEEDLTQSNESEDSGQLLVTYDKKLRSEDGTNSTEVTSEMKVLSRGELKRQEYENILVVEVKRIVAISKELSAEIKSSTTRPKKQYFNKKLAKNNKSLMKMLTRLDSVSKADNELE